MNRNIKSYIILICGVLCMNSCDPPQRGMDCCIKEHARKESVPININLLETSYENDEIHDTKNVKYTIVGDNIGATEIERRLDYPQNEALVDGVTCRIVVYKKVIDKYVWQKNNDFIVGKTNFQNFNLDSAGNYTLIIYSLGNRDALPDIVNKSYLDEAYIDYASAKDLLYQRIDNFIPSEEQNSLNIRLKHKLTGVRLEIDASDFYGGNIPMNIVSINDPKIRHKKSLQSKLKISDASKDIILKNKEVALDNVSFNEENGVKIISDWKSLTIDTSTTENVVFSAEIEMSDGTKEILNIPIHDIKPDFRQTIKLNLQLCGVNMGNGWKQFMCHDLGADYNANPFKADKKLHGDKYQWGHPYFGKKRLTASEDQQNEIIYNWNMPDEGSPGGDYNKPWTGKDPCPDSYRIPTSKEIEELAKLKFDVVGNILNKNNYESGFILSEGGNLFFPTSGMRGADGKIYNRGNEAWIWSSGIAESNPSYADLLKIPAPNDKSVVDSQSSGISIRCIKK